MSPHENRNPKDSDPSTDPAADGGGGAAHGAPADGASQDRAPARGAELDQAPAAAAEADRAPADAAPTEVMPVLAAVAHGAAAADLATADTAVHAVAAPGPAAHGSKPTVRARLTDLARRRGLRRVVVALLGFVVLPGGFIASKHVHLARPGGQAGATGATGATVQAHDTAAVTPVASISAAAATTAAPSSGATGTTGTTGATGTAGVAAGGETAAGSSAPGVPSTAQAAAVAAGESGAAPHETAAQRAHARAVRKAAARARAHADLEAAAMTAPTSGPAPACQAPTLNVSDQLPGTPLEVSPLPGTLVATPDTQISLLGAPAADIGAISAVGSVSGAHAGRLEAYSQGDGASFVPTRPFKEGETVTVRGAVTVHGQRVPFTYHFTVADEDPLPHPPPGTQPQGTPGEVQHYRSRPDLEPPSVTVTTDQPGTAPGYVFSAPYSGPGEDGPMIFDDKGQLVWFHPVPHGDEATNLQVGTYLGKPVLTWWEGYIPPQGFGEGAEEIANSSYKIVKFVHAGNGLTVDLHEFHLLPDDEAVFTVFDPVRCNLTAVKGSANAATTDTLFQIVDLKTGLVMREWHALDHVALTNSDASATNSSVAWPFDYFHLNSISFASDGDFVVSSRNTSAFYILNPRTLQVSAEVGGKDSTVSMGSGTTTNYQHDVVAQPGDTFTLFDNGGSPQVEPQSRAIVEKLDLATHTVTELTQYTHAGSSVYSDSQGDFQTLSNGDAFIGWGQSNYITEFSPSGKTLFEAEFPPDTEAYRSYRFQWTGQPDSRPAIAASRASDGWTTVYLSWNGATTVSSWRVLAGPSPSELSPVATAPRTGFQTLITTTDPGPYVAAQALGANGQVLATTLPVEGSG